MTFYTCVNRYGKNILYRGYDDNGNRIHRKVPFKPTLFLPSKKSDTIWKALDGTPVEPIQLDSMSEAKDFVEQYRDVDNFTVHGNTNYVAQFIQEKFPGNIQFNSKFIDIGNIDIEVASDDGFPYPEQADHPIISIAYKSTREGVFHVWGLGDYSAQDSELNLDGNLIQYRKCASERDLIEKFMLYWQINTPDIITGWNIRLFDIPYMINRILKVCGEKTAKMFSPWGIYNYRQVKMKFKSLDAYEIYGVQQVDYIDLFQKFGYTYGNQESYALDHIASVILGEKKLSYEEYGSLHSLYKNNYQKFTDYNILDVDLVRRIDEETGLMELALTIAYKGGVNYTDAFGTTAIWDSIIYRYLAERNVAIPPNIRKNKDPYEGGYVKEPRIGMSEWITSFDLNSLYPNIIVQTNMSPETLVKDVKLESGVDHYLNLNSKVETEYAVAANGSCYRKDKQGFMPEIIIALYDERKKTKKEMLNLKQQSQLSPSDDLKKSINKLDNTQMAVKIMLNSLYGALGNAYFRYFEMDIAEGITLTGQLAIRWAEKAMNRSLNKAMNTDKDYVIAIDTDSLYVDMSDLVKAVNPKDPVKFIDKASEEKFVPALAKAYDDLANQMNSYTNRMVMAREAIADRGIWTAKKRYILNVHNNEGVQYSEPKLKVMGIEAVKSSTPQVVRNKFKEAYKIMLSGTESELQDFVEKFYDEFKNLPPEQVSFPRGISEIDKWYDRSTIYKKSTPIHVRGALLHNELLKQTGLDKRMESIKDGAKVKFCYLKMPNPIMENVISFTQFLPQEFGITQYIDYETQFNKTFKDPLKLVSDAIQWDLEKRSTLEDFFA